MVDSRPSAEQRQFAGMRKANQKPLNLAEKSTPLAAEMTEQQAAWLLEHACDQWQRHYSSLQPWRIKMSIWEHMSEMDYSDRIGKPDPNNPESVRDVFSYQNDTLGMSEGFCDFATAQARDDIFGTKPWLGATPEGRSDPALAELISKHSNWKLNQSDLEACIKDGIKVACWGGTAFLKTRWDKQTEVYKKRIKVAYSISGKTPFLDPQSGDFLTTVAQLEAMGVDGADVAWNEQLVQETLNIYDNTRTGLLDFKDIAFDSKAAELDLSCTDFYCRFRMGLLDVMNHYKIPQERRADLRSAFISGEEGARIERGETNLSNPAVSIDDDRSNPPISLVEGFMRCDPLNTGDPVRIHYVFSPELRIAFRVDYLANITPAATLPVFPLRIGKMPGRVLGVGYFEKYENANNSADRQLNSTTWRNQRAAHVITALQPDALLDKESKDYLLDASRPVVLDHDKKIQDFVGFAVIPDTNSRAIELLNMHLQMAQMRSGITSAAQGELKGVPNASTATGVNQLTSRGALLLKDPITELTTDITPLVSHNVDLVYANLDQDEVFIWGEGEAAELLTIKANDVRGLKMNVNLKLVQSQNQSKLANAQAAIGLVAAYIAVPEMEKPAVRDLYIQALASLGFSNAEDIIRKAVTDPAGIIALLPPEVAPIVAQALVAAGIMAPEAGAATAPPAVAPAPLTGSP